MVVAAQPSAAALAARLGGGAAERATLLDTTLNKLWLSKTLREGLVMPALEAMGVSSPEISTIEVDGAGLVDGNAFNISAARDVDTDVAHVSMQRVAEYHPHHHTYTHTSSI